MVWRFVTFHLKKKRERLAELAATQKKKQQQAKAAKKSECHSVHFNMGPDSPEALVMIVTTTF